MCSRKFEDMNSRRASSELLSEDVMLVPGFVDLVDQSMNGRLKSPVICSSGVPTTVSINS